MTNQPRPSDEKHRSHTTESRPGAHHVQGDYRDAAAAATTTSDVPARPSDEKRKLAAVGTSSVESSRESRLPDEQKIAAKELNFKPENFPPRIDVMVNRPRPSDEKRRHVIAASRPGAHHVQGKHRASDSTTGQIGEPARPSDEKRSALGIGTSRVLPQENTRRPNEHFVQQIDDISQESRERRTLHRPTSLVRPSDEKSGIRRPTSLVRPCDEKSGFRRPSSLVRPSDGKAIARSQAQQGQTMQSGAVDETPSNRHDPSRGLRQFSSFTSTNSRPCDEKVKYRHRGQSSVSTSIQRVSSLCSYSDDGSSENEVEAKYDHRRTVSSQVEKRNVAENDERQTPRVLPAENSSQPHHPSEIEDPSDGPLEEQSCDDDALDEVSQISGESWSFRRLVSPSDEKSDFRRPMSLARPSDSKSNGRLYNQRSLSNPFSAVDETQSQQLDRIERRISRSRGRSSSITIANSRPCDDNARYHQHGQNSVSLSVDRQFADGRSVEGQSLGGQPYLISHSGNNSSSSGRNIADSPELQSASSQDNRREPSSDERLTMQDNECGGVVAIPAQDDGEEMMKRIRRQIESEMNREPAVAVGEEVEEWRKPTKKQKILFILFLTTIIAVSVLTAIFAPKGSPTESIYFSPTASPSMTPSSMPSGAPSMSPTGEVWSKIVSVLEQSDIFIASNVTSDHSSPQHQALLWMSEQDEVFHQLYEKLATRSSASIEIQERYAVVTMVFALDLAGVNFLLDPNSSVCQWKAGSSMGVFCEENGPQVYAIILSEFDRLRRQLHFITVVTYELMCMFSESLGGEGAIPAEVAILKQLVVLEITEAAIVQPLPSSMVQLQSLKRLELANNRLDGPIPLFLYEMTSLESLSLSENKLTGSISPDISKLTNIRFLDLDSNSLSSSIPSEIGGLSDLVRLQLSSCGMDGTIPTEIFLSLTKLQKLNLLHNRLVGTIPSLLGNLSMLNELFLSENSFTGIFSTTLGFLTDLSRLDLYQNKFRGPLPSEVGLLRRLEIIRLNDNQISGQIPSELGLLTGITDMEIYQNRFNGRLPSELGMLTEISKLEIYDNNVSGEVPSSFGNLVNLENVEMYQMNISGSLDDIFCNNPALERLVFVSVDFCEAREDYVPNDRVRCSCCFMCCGPNGCFAI